MSHRFAKTQSPETFVVKEQQKQARLLRSELEKMTSEEVSRLLVEEKEKSAKRLLDKNEREEQLRFFNQESAKAGFDYWSKMSYWSLDECIALSLGRDPRVVNWENVKSLTKISPFAASYKNRREIICRAEFMGQLWVQTIPAIFVAWAERMQVSFPDELVVAVRKIGTQVRDWKSAHDEQEKAAEEANKKLLECMECRSADMLKFKDKYEEMSARLSKQVEERNKIIHSCKEKLAALESQKPSAEKGLSTRERESLLKIVIGMAIQGYGHDPKARRTSTAAEIASDLERLDLTLDPDTVRKYLQEGSDLVPGEETE